MMRDSLFVFENKVKKNQRIRGHGSIILLQDNSMVKCNILTRSLHCRLYSSTTSSINIQHITHTYHDD